MKLQSSRQLSNRLLLWHCLGATRSLSNRVSFKSFWHAQDLCILCGSEWLRLDSMQCAWHLASALYMGYDVGRRE